CEVRRWHAIDVDGSATGLDRARLSPLRRLVRSVIHDDVDAPVERAVRPVALLVPRIVPTVVAPVPAPDDEVEVAVAFVIDEMPLVRADLSLRQPDVLRTGDRLARVETSLAKLTMDRTRGRHERSRRPMGDPSVRAGSADTHRRAEDGKEYVAVRVLEEPQAAERNVRASDEEIEIAIAVEVARKRPGPQSHAQIRDEMLVAVTDRLEVGRTRPGRRAGRLVLGKKPVRDDERGSDEEARQ